MEAEWELRKDIVPAETETVGDTRAESVMIIDRVRDFDLLTSEDLVPVNRMDEVPVDDRVGPLVDGLGSDTEEDDVGVVVKVLVGVAVGRSEFVVVSVGSDFVWLMSEVIERDAVRLGMPQLVRLRIMSVRNAPVVLNGLGRVEN